MKKKTITEILAFILAFTVFISVTYYLGYIYMPPRENYGATWNMYKKEKKNSIDVMFVGSSLAYCDIIPAKIYEETGLTSYIIGAPNMNPGVAYYYIKEALKTQSPKLVMMEATTFCFSGITKEDSKINIGYMPWSFNRIKATFDIADPGERAGLLFPLYNYHSRWADHTANSVFSPRSDAKTDIWAGYTYLDQANPQEEVTDRKYDIEDSVFDENMHYLEKIVELCKEKEIALELFTVPSCKYVSKELVKEISGHAKGIPFTYYNESFDSLELDIKKDFYDTLHLNFKGAEKFSLILAEHISESYNFKPVSHDNPLWEERVENYATTSKEFVLKES